MNYIRSNTNVFFVYSETSEKNTFLNILYDLGKSARIQ